MNEVHSYYKVGDTVTWTSQAGGCTKTKTGTVIAIAHVGTPYRKLGTYVPASAPKSNRKFDDKFPDQARYIIEVPRGTKSGVCDYYAPMVHVIDAGTLTPEQYAAHVKAAQS
jgi:hypothetical protein